jgi:hypothetical protein
MPLILRGMEAQVLALKLWRDYVIATLSVDAGIVFCFALESKFESREQTSGQCAGHTVLFGDWRGDAHFAHLIRSLDSRA